MVEIAGSIPAGSIPRLFFPKEKSWESKESILHAYEVSYRIYSTDIWKTMFSNIAGKTFPVDIG